MSRIVIVILIYHRHKPTDIVVYIVIAVFQRVNRLLYILIAASHLQTPIINCRKDLRSLTP
jgi:hypothetical protein